MVELNGEYEVPKDEYAVYNNNPLYEIDKQRLTFTIGDKGVVIVPVSPYIELEKYDDKEFL